MEIFILTRLGETPYEEYDKMAIKARDENRARIIAQYLDREDEDNVWLDPAKSDCLHVAMDGLESVICASKIEG